MTDSSKLIVPWGKRQPDVYLKGREAAREFALANGFKEDSFIEIQAQWSDQDPNNHITNTVYFKWAEYGRLWAIEAMFRSFPPHLQGEFRGQGKGKGMILGYLSNKYLRPTFWPDHVLVAHKLIEVKDRKFKLESLTYSYAQQAPVGRGEAELAAYDYDELKSCALSPEILKELRSRLPAPSEKL
ncbi:hypothetical protein T439DRAFT_375907 [Meredithblackwellia eburnea MCA 4105]